MDLDTIDKSLQIDLDNEFDLSDSSDELDTEETEYQKDRKKDDIAFDFLREIQDFAQHNNISIGEHLSVYSIREFFDTSQSK